MATAARLAIAARRNEARAFTVKVIGLDLTGGTFLMQVRLKPDTPGVPLFALSTVTNGTAEGIQLVGTPAVIDGVMTSTLRVRINKTTMSDAAKVPYGGEVGSDTVLAYGFQINGVTRLAGDFVALASAVDSDSAPTNRPAGGYPAASSAPSFENASLIFDNGDIRVAIEGIEEVAAALADVEQAKTETASYRDQAQAAATNAAQAALDELAPTLDVLDQFHEVDQYGRTAAPVAGAVPTSRTYVLNSPVTRAGPLTRLRVWSQAAGTLYLKRFTKSGATFTQVGADVAVTLASGFNDITALPALEFGSGEYIGWYSANLVHYTNGASADGGGYYSSGAANVGTFDDASADTGYRFQIGFELETFPLTVETFGEVQQDVAAAQQAIALGSARTDQLFATLTNVVTAKIGRAVAPVDGITGSAKTFVFAAAVSDGGFLKRVKVFARTAGDLKLKVFSRSGNDFTEVGNVTVTMAAGLNSFDAGNGDFAALPVPAGAYLGYYAAARVAVTSATGDSGGYYDGAGDATAFTDSGSTGSFRLEIGFEVDQVAPKSPGASLAGQNRSRLALLLAAGAGTVVFTLWGQSNTIGRAAFDGGNPHPAGTAQWGRTSPNDGQTIAAANMLDFTGGNAGQMGPSIEFARAFVAAYPGIQLLFVPAAVGGTSFNGNQWNPGNGPYLDAVNRTNAVMAANPDFAFGGMFGQIGETDADANNADFQSQLDAALLGFRSDINVADEATPIALGQLGPAFVAAGGGAPAVQAAITATPSRLPNIGVAPSTGLTLIDTYHYNAASLRTIGGRYFTAWKAALARQAVV